jgi:hypothetical protein
MILPALAVGLTLGQAPAPAASPPPVTASLRALEAVLERVPTASTAGGEAKRARTALASLLALSVNWPAQSPESYRRNLAAEAAAVERSMRAGDAPDLAATMQSVADDLEAKLEHCRASGGKLGGSIRVRVRTVRGAVESRSWQVFYMPKVLEAAGGASPDLFPQLSSPTEDTLVPGRYVMWVRNPATARLGERTVVKVGEGRSELLLDLPVPPDPPR